MTAYEIESLEKLDEIILTNNEIINTNNQIIEQIENVTSGGAIVIDNSNFNQKINNINSLMYVVILCVFVIYFYGLRKKVRWFR